MNTTENNKLIAEFMGLHKFGNKKTSDTYHHDIPDYRLLDKGLVNPAHHYTPDQMKYHSSWDWLMPVVEKIEDIGFEFFIVENRSKVCHNTDKSIDVLSYLEGGNKLDITYQTVVEFIKWYNKEINN
jgi:hypothetical protein